MQLTLASARKTIEQMDIKDGDIITVRPRSGGPAPSMVGLTSRRSASRNSFNRMGSFAKKGSFVKLSGASAGALVSPCTSTLLHTYISPMDRQGMTASQ